MNDAIQNHADEITRLDSSISSTASAGLSAAINAQKAADDATQKANTAQLGANTAGNTANTALGNSINNAQAITAANNALTGKVDQTVYDADKTTQAATDAGQQTGIDANTTGVSTNKGDISALDKRVQSNTTFAGAINADVQQVKIDNVKRDQTITDNTNAITTEATTRQSQVDALTTKVDADKHSIDMNTQSVHNLNGITSQNKSDIAGHEGRITTLEGDITGKADKTTVSALDSKVGGIDTRVSDNSANIMTNNGMIIDNANDISGLRTDVDQNKQDIAGKADKADLATKVNITTYVTGQAQQQSAIDANKTAIAGNTTTITSNTQATTNNRTFINQNTSAVHKLNSDVIDNKTNITTNTNAISSNTRAISGNTVALANKVETSAFTADQQRQDSAIAAKADATQVQANRRAIADENVQEQQHFTTLSASVQQAKDTGAYAQKRANDAFANADTNRQALAATNQKVADHSAELANHEQRIETLEQNNSTNFSKLKNEVDDNRKRASAAISGVAAMANIPQVIESQTFNLGAGVGTTDGETALAVGFSARASEHVVVKSAVSNDTQHNFVVGAGVAYGW